MTSPEKSINQARVCACVCQKAWIKSSLFIWCDSTQQRLHKDVPTPAPSLTLQLSKTCHPLPRMHSLILKDGPLWPLTYSIWTPAPHSPHWLCSGPTFCDVQSPSVTLTFHLHKDRKDMDSLYSLLTSSAVSSVSEKMMDAHTNCSFLLFPKSSALSILQTCLKDLMGVLFCMLTKQQLYITSYIARVLIWFRFLPSRQLLVSIKCYHMATIWKLAETCLIYQHLSILYYH